MDGFLLAAGVIAVGWGAAHYGFDRIAHLAFTLSLVLVLVTACRTVFHGLTFVRLTPPRIPASEEVRRHAARQAGLDPDA
ncbi:hypothetical protein [Streptomyces sp. NBC_01264]|uniref:hypothetical protein n=1 Tax=Streptomyces sp. NBC_01264 TaxID=2903804 RepID=UPI002256B293|nr:hypothetical protein [Streptomyces sp. NBC_01264]MCX4775428.1 hypothetical protein [Streptomyces sp. NBC_01264]